MYRRFLALIAVGGSLTACAQMTRHSNTLVFGTNTSFGLSVSAEATNTPGITVGYKRQEAVIMPLVANTVDNGRTLGPCPMTPPTSVSRSGIDPTGSCLLQGTEPVAGDSDARDTYSVLASFGAKFGATADRQNPQASGQIAQYFATGLAARALAENGGSSVIATGEAARANSRVLASENMNALMKSPENIRRVENGRGRRAAAREIVATHIASSGANLAKLLAAMDAAIAPNTSDLTDTCKTKTDPVACADAIRKDVGLADLTATEWEAAAKVTL